MKSPLSHIGYFFGKKALFAVVLLATGLAVWGLLLLSEKLRIHALVGVAGFVFLVGLLTAFFSVPEVIARLENGATAGVTFTDAVVLTYRGYFILLSFVPIIGTPFRWLVTRHQDSPGRNDKDA
jgi:hypothetical protein